MGKGTKRKNAGVGVDFRRVKHNVGKKLPKAQNQTDTNFKSRAINLPDQSVLQDKQGAAVTHRNLTLKDLINQCGHYSEKVRREAVQGLAELLAAHPRELRRNPSLVMETLAARITDGDQGVRAALRATLASPVLPTLGPAALGPVVPLLMAHVCSAMTHLADQIRGDSLGVLQLLSEWRPDMMSSPAFLAPTLDHFGDLLSKGSRGRSLAAGSLQALQKTVGALEGLLRRLGTAGAAEERGGAGHELQGVGKRGGEGSVPLFRCRSRWPPLAAAMAVAGAPGSGPGAAGGMSGGRGGKGGEEGGAASAEEAARKLLGHLLECWSDCGPAQLVQAPELPLALCLLSVLRCCNLLLAWWGVKLAGSCGPSGDKSSLAASLLHRLSPLFPLCRPSTPVPPPLEEALVQINVALAQLLARFLPSQLAVQGGAAAGPNGGREGGWPGRLLDWFEGVMRGDGGALPDAGQGVSGGGGKAWVESEAATGGGNAAAEARGGQEGRRQRKKAGKGGKGGGEGERGSTAASGQLPVEVYSAALEGVRVVLPLVGGGRRRQLLGAMWTLWERCSVRSAKRVQVLQVWRGLLSSPAASFHTPLPPSGAPLVLHHEALTWLQAMPRFLWELGGSCTATTESALRLLLDGACFACCDAAALAPLQQQLAPLFATLLPPRAHPTPKAGGQRSQQQRQQRLLPGPLAKQAQHIQQLGVDVLLQLPSLPPSTLALTATCCLSPGLLPLPVALRLLEGVAAKACIAWREAALPSQRQPGGQARAWEGQGDDHALHAVPAAAGGGALSGEGASQSGEASGSDGDVEEGEGEGGNSRQGGSESLAAGFGGLLLCALSGTSRAGVEGREAGPGAWRRHEAVVDGACRALLGWADAGAMAQALAAPLVDLCRASRSPHPLHGAVSLGAALSAGAACTAGAAPALPPPLAAQLPEIMLCYVVVCAAEQRPHTREGPPGDSVWLPPPQEALGLCMRLLRTMPSLLAPLLDCISATLSKAAQLGERAQQAQHSVAASAGGGCASNVVDCWMAGELAPADVAPARHDADVSSKTTPVVSHASWLLGGNLLLEGIFRESREDSLDSEVLLREEARAMAAVRACEVAAGELEAVGKLGRDGASEGAARVRTLCDALWGRGG